MVGVKERVGTGLTPVDWFELNLPEQGPLPHQEGDGHN
jgi:hypothetical protein